MDTSCSIEENHLPATAKSFLVPCACLFRGNPRKLVKAEKRGTIFTVVVNIWSLVLDGTEIPLKSSSALTALIAVLGG